MTERHALDKAGAAYWNQTWTHGALPPPIDPSSKSWRGLVDRKIFAWLVATLASHGLTGPDVSVVEVGCARSKFLPALAKQLGVTVTGIDYSPVGCEQALALLQRDGIAGAVHCLDVLALPEPFHSRFDVVFSNGLVEHFSDTNQIVSALAALLKPGGLLLTLIPNLCGTLGWLQKTFNRAIYDIHVPLSPNALRQAHEAAGLRVVAAEYFLSNNYGVLNVGEAPANALPWRIKKASALGLAMLSRGILWGEALLGVTLPATRAFAPYIHCCAIKPS